MKTLAKYSLSTFCATAVIAVPLVFAAKPPPPPPPAANVTTIIHDEDTAVPPNQLLFRSDDLYSAACGLPVAFQGCYNDPSNFGSVMSTVESGWGLELYNQSLRKVWLTLSQPVGNSPPSPAPDGLYSAKIQVYSRCYTDSTGSTRLPVSNLSMTPGSSNDYCDLGVTFESGRTTYQFILGPLVPGTGWVSVHCTGGSPGACNAWTIAPNTLGGNDNVAKLRIIGNRGFTDIGLYYNTFRIDATYP